MVKIGAQLPKLSQN